MTNETTTITPVEHILTGTAIEAGVNKPLWRDGDKVAIRYAGYEVVWDERDETGEILRNGDLAADLTMDSEGDLFICSYDSGPKGGLYIEGCGIDAFLDYYTCL